jgi:hypothetical protein
MLEYERTDPSSTRNHVQRDRAKSEKTHEDEPVRPDLVERLLSRPKLIPIMAWLIREHAFLLLLALVEEVMEIEIVKQLLVRGDPSAPMVPPTKKNSHT